MAIVEISNQTTQEIAQMKETLFFLKQLGAVIENVELRGKKRLEDSSITNADVLLYLKEGNSRSEDQKKRDYVSMTPEDARELATVFADVAASEYQKYLNRSQKQLAKAQRTGQDVANLSKKIEAQATQKANQIAAKAFMEAMKLAIEKISDRIKDERDFKGDKVEQLSEEYEDQKRRDHGHIHPIGVATGQVLENLSPNVPGNIRLNKRK